MCLLALVAVGCGRGRERAGSAPSTITVFYFEEAAFSPSWDMPAKFLVFLPLVARNAEGELESRLAERWERSPDYRDWTVHLRRDVRWHDGVPVTAHDVKFTLDLLSHPAVLKVPPGAFSLTVLDDSTYRITCHKQAKGSPLDGWTVYYPKHLLEKLDPRDFYQWNFWTRPVGNGPYRYLRRLTGSMTELEANRDYYRGKPRIERVVLKYGQLSVTEILSGNVDVLPYVPSMDLLKIEGDPRFRVYSYVGPVVTEFRIPKAILWNQRHPPLRDARVRRALTLAINRRELHQALNLPEEMPITDVPYTAGQFRRGEIPDPLPYDPEQAKRLLEEAGWRDTDGDGWRDRNGQPFRFTLRTTAAEGDDKPALYIQAQLRRVGIQVDIQSLNDAAAHDERVRDGDFEAAIFRRFPGGRFGPIKYFGKDSPIGYHNPQLVALLEHAQRTIDPDEVDRLYRETWPIFQADQPMTFHPVPGMSTVAHRRVRGLSGPCQADPTECMEELWLEDRSDR
ncbi:MAG TPA: ABC transporter substrate-binding protein [Gemmatimonadota bacterium]|nr:ABC transporter substrate-binding protein [Gemmatimonadota bacterium]